MTDSTRHTHKQTRVIKGLKQSSCFLLEPGMGSIVISPELCMVPTTNLGKADSISRNFRQCGYRRISGGDNILCQSHVRQNIKFKANTGQR